MYLLQRELPHENVATAKRKCALMTESGKNGSDA